MAHARGGCYRCSRGDNLIDLDVHIEGEGVLVLCKGCVLEAAEAAGLHLNAAAVAEIQAAHEEERRQFGPDRITELEAQLHEAQQALALAEAVDKRLAQIAEAARDQGRRKR